MGLVSRLTRLTPRSVCWVWLVLLAVAEELGGTGEFLPQALKTYVETGEVLEPPV